MAKDKSAGKFSKLQQEKKYSLGKSQIFTPEVMNDIHIKSELGRYRMRGVLTIQEDTALG